MGGCAIAAVSLPASLEAKKRRGKNNKKRPATRKGDPVELPTVQRVGGGSLTVNGKYYEVSKDADITVNGEDANLGDIKKGMQVLVSAKVLSYGKTSKDTVYLATRITARRNSNLKAKANNSNKKKK